jgi:hypothetical protein
LKATAKNSLKTLVLIGSNGGDTLRVDVIELFKLMEIPRTESKLGVVAFGNGYFHPKTLHFVRKDASQLAYVGSANLTSAGLAKHVEAGVVLDSREGDSIDVLNEIKSSTDTWFDGQLPGLFLVDSLDVVRRLVESKILSITPKPTKVAVSGVATIPGGAALPSLAVMRSLPTMAQVTASPAAAATPSAITNGATSAPAIPPPAVSVFLMTLHQTDIGVGQTTTGTAKRSPEFFVPLAARDAFPDFWGWPNSFTADLATPGKFDRPGVRVRLGATMIDLNMMTWPVKHDFRLRSEALRSSAGSIGDILYLEVGSGSYDYYGEIIPIGSARHAQYLAYCTNPTQNSTRVWGYM